MIRWEPSDPRRLHSQEQALLALYDRVQTLEKLTTIDIDRTRALGARIDRLERQLAEILALLKGKA